MCSSLHDPPVNATLSFNVNGYEFTPVPSADGRLPFSNESTVYIGYLTPSQRVKETTGLRHFEV